ncbi:MAG: BolA family transcriptional regulator [Rickettsiaceae bacterium]|jgi:BolA protein|nr:BolA family transcriptional regulator [Rickettsiaceae bacterium]
MNRQETIEQKLSVLKPQYLEIINDSYLHSSHKSSPANGESHFTIKILADSLSCHSLIEQHKIIKNLLKEEFTRGLHALSIIIVK